MRRQIQNPFAVSARARGLRYGQLRRLGSEIGESGRPRTYATRLSLVLQGLVVSRSSAVGAVNREDSGLPQPVVGSIAGPDHPLHFQKNLFTQSSDSLIVDNL